MRSYVAVGLLSELVAGVPSDAESVVKLFAFLREQRGYRDFRFLHESLVEQAGFGKEFLDFAVDYFFDYLWRLVGDLFGVDRAFGGYDILRYFLGGEMSGAACCDMERDVFDQLLETVGPVSTTRPMVVCGDVEREILDEFPECVIVTGFFFFAGNVDDDSDFSTQMDI